MEFLGMRYSLEDTAVPKLCLTGMPIVGKALESPFFHSYQVPATITVSELLSSAPRRRAGTLKRVKLMGRTGGAEMAKAIWKKTMKDVKAGTMSGPYTLEEMEKKHGRYLNLVPSFGLKQGDKFRRIDDHSASHNNWPPRGLSRSRWPWWITSCQWLPRWGRPSMVPCGLAPKTWQAHTAKSR